MPTASSVIGYFSRITAVVGATVVTKALAGSLVKLSSMNATAQPVWAPAMEKPVALVSHPDYEDFETTVVIEAGRSTRLDAALEPRASVFETWWFWTITGGVVAAGAVTGIVIAATTEQEPGSGDIPPGQVAAPIRGGTPALWIALPPFRF